VGSPLEGEARLDNLNRGHRIHEVAVCKVAVHDLRRPGELDAVLAGDAPVALEGGDVERDGKLVVQNLPILAMLLDVDREGVAGPDLDCESGVLREGVALDRRWNEGDR
jgi:hypothetical protein